MTTFRFVYLLEQGSLLERSHKKRWQADTAIVQEVHCVSMGQQNGDVEE